MWFAVSPLGLKGTVMDLNLDSALVTLGCVVLALVALDLLALRFGRDSRRLSGTRRNWW